MVEQYRSTLRLRLERSFYLMDDSDDRLTRRLIPNRMRAAPDSPGPSACSTARILIECVNSALLPAPIKALFKCEALNLFNTRR